jgi:chemosensory pili system protein ChpE/L-lysine exporter family protein LysE/ArgO
VASLFISAFLLGLIFNAAPGAVFAETVRQGARHGFPAAFAVQVGSLLGDALWAILGLLGVGLLLQVKALQLPLAIAGITYLLWLAFDSWRASSRPFETRQNLRVETRHALRSGALISLTNPTSIGYWAALGSALGTVGIRDPQTRDYVVFFAGFMVSSLLWTVFCAAVVARLFSRAGARWVRIAYRLCAVAFVVLAVFSLRNLLAAG